MMPDQMGAINTVRRVSTFQVPFSSHVLRLSGQHLPPTDQNPGVSRFLSDPGLPQLSHSQVPPISLLAQSHSVPTATVLVQGSAFLLAHCTVSRLASRLPSPRLSAIHTAAKVLSPQTDLATFIFGLESFGNFLFQSRPSPQHGWQDLRICPASSALPHKLQLNHPNCLQVPIEDRVSAASLCTPRSAQNPGWLPAPSLILLQNQHPRFPPRPA